MTPFQTPNKGLGRGISEGYNGSFWRIQWEDIVTFFQGSHSSIRHLSSSGVQICEGGGLLGVWLRISGFRDALTIFGVAIFNGPVLGLGDLMVRARNMSMRCRHEAW